MKLNNHGWSLGTMLVLLCILILAVLLVFFFMYKSGMENNQSKYNNVDIFNSKFIKYY